MNKKILALAFVSAAFFFGCAADNLVPSSTDPEPPAWNSAPTSKNPPAGNPKGGYCFAGGMCVKFNGYFTLEDCYDLNGSIADSCPHL